MAQCWCTVSDPVLKRQCFLCIISAGKRFPRKKIPKTFTRYCINTLMANSNKFNVHPLEVVSRYRDPQLQVGENYSYLFDLRPNICKSGSCWCFYWMKKWSNKTKVVIEPVISGYLVKCCKWKTSGTGTSISATSFSPFWLQNRSRQPPCHLTKFKSPSANRNGVSWVKVRLRKISVLSFFSLGECHVFAESASLDSLRSRDGLNSHEISLRCL